MCSWHNMAPVTLCEGLHKYKQKRWGGQVAAAIVTDM